MSIYRELRELRKELERVSREYDDLVKILKLNRINIDELKLERDIKKDIINEILKDYGSL